MRNRVYTNYPIKELGDKPGEDAPFREAELLSYDGNKYCKIRIGGYNGVVTEVKLGYLYLCTR